LSVPDERLRIQIAFEGGQMVSAIVADAAFAQLRSALGADTIVEIETEDGTIVIPTRSVAYVKRFSRETSIGFGI
jgi:hypothetical protein